MPGMPEPAFKFSLAGIEAVLEKDPQLFLLWPCPGFLAYSLEMLFQSLQWSSFLAEGQDVFLLLLYEQSLFHLWPVPPQLHWMPTMTVLVIIIEGLFLGLWIWLFLKKL